MPMLSGETGGLLPRRPWRYLTTCTVSPGLNQEGLSPSLTSSPWTQVTDRQTGWGTPHHENFSNQDGNPAGKSRSAKPPPPPHPTPPPSHPHLKINITIFKTFLKMIFKSFCGRVPQHDSLLLLLLLLYISSKYNENQIMAQTDQSMINNNGSFSYRAILHKK